MEHLIIPENYSSALNLHDTQIGIKTVKDFFQSLLVRHLNLLRVSAPLFVDPASGMNDNLNGYERPVSFGILEQNDYRAEVVQSLAKWKRYALKEYGFSLGEGLYTDMNAIRRDETTDNIHFRRSVGLGKGHRQKGPQPGNLKSNRPRRLQGAAQNGNVHGDPV